MAKNLDGDRKQLGQDEPGRAGVRVMIALGLVLAAIALAVWRHFG